MGRVGIFICFVSAMLLASCDRDWPDTQWRAERYMLLEIDSRSQMSLSFDLQDGTSLGLVGPTVFAVGSNEKFIVLKQHPARDHFASSFDRTVTNYFVVQRTSSPDFKERRKGVVGPLSREEFDKLALKLALPSFSETFADLE